MSTTAPAQAPIARDDAVDRAQARSSSTVTVPVLDNDEDPDGDITENTVTSTDDGVSVDGDGSLTIEVRESQRYVLYTVTDADGLTASAVVDVPGSVITEPEIDTSKAPVEVRAGELLTIALNEYVLTRAGRTVQLTDGNKVTAAAGWDGSALVKDSTTLTFTAKPDYSGPSSVTFEVTDGEDLNDSGGRVAYLTLPITVTPGDNRPPVITPTTVEVAAGEGAITVDVSRWTTDPDGEDTSGFSYEVSNAPSGVEVGLSGRNLSVEASAQTPKGPAGSLTMTATDSSGAQTSASVPITVVSSTRAPIQLSSATISADAGKPVSVDVSKYASNPFPDTPLHVVGTPSSSDGASVSVSGTTLTTTPPAGSHGTTVITYRVGDKTNDVDREVQGTIQVTVRDRPDAPTRVSATSNSASTALVSWSAGSANGAPITGFTLYDTTQGDSKECGLVTSCLFEGRRNGQDHTFHVVAHNEVGDSDSSGSATTNIDVVPGTVPQPVGTPGDMSLSVSWSAPSNDGSAITSYTVALSPGGQQQTVTGTSATFTGLSNGTAYTAVVKAENSKGASREWSTASTAVTPYGRPGPVGSVSAAAANLGASGSTDTVTVSWGPVSDVNGRGIEYYTVTSSNGVSKTVQGGGSLSTTLEGVSVSNDQVTFSVTATNDSSAAGSHTSAPMSTSTWVVGKPSAPSASGLTATGNDNEISMSTSAVAGNGWRTADLYVQWSTDGATWQAVSNLRGNGLSNGSASTVSVRACGEKTGSTACSDAATVGSVTPFGSPVAASMSCTASGTRVDCSWSGGSGNGRDTSFTLSGQQSGSVGGSGSVGWDVGEGVHVRLCIKGVQHSSEVGDRSTAESCAEARTRSYTRGKTTYKAAQQFTGGTGFCRNGTCNVVGLRLTDWPPNTTVNCTGVFNKTSISASIAIDGAGNASYEGNWNGIAGKLGADSSYSAQQWANMISNLQCS